MEIYDEFEFEILGEPLTWQSVKVARKVNGGMIFYTPKEIKNKKGYISNIIIDTLKETRTDSLFPTDKAIGIEALFCYKIPDTLPKKKIKMFYERYDSGYPDFRSKRPDLQDNLMKGLIDSLTGIIWMDDKQIVYINSAKIYDKQSKTILKIKILNGGIIC